MPTACVLMLGVVMAFAAALPLAAQASLHDPADLAGIQVKPGDTIRTISANEGATALWQTLTALNTRASLMMIVAHPDDEDSGMLTYESRGQGVHTAMLTLTRGEGGQNIMSGDFNDALGLVRTEELLSADQYFGIDQLWGTEIDFGFSKTKEESLAQWNHDRVLYDAVRAVRLYRPLVLTAVFAGAVTDGHGQHQVSGEIAQEAFNAAGDPTVFPDQIAAGLLPWSPTKVYARVPFYSISPKGLFDYATGKYAPANFYNYVTHTSSTTEPTANVRIPEGRYSPVLGMSYLQFARLGLGLQKSQNGGMGIPAAGMVTVPYHRYGSRASAAGPDSDTESEGTFFDDIDTSVVGIHTLAAEENSFLQQNLARIADLIKQATAAYSIASPERTAPLLHDGLAATDALLAKVTASNLTAAEKYNLDHELTLKRTQFNQALVEALGLSVRAQVAPDHENSGPFAGFQDAPETLTTVVPGSSFAVQLHVVNPSVVPLKVKRSWLTGSVGTQLSSESGPGQPILSYRSYDRRIAVTLAADTPVTRPPFLQARSKDAFYTVADPNLRNASFAPAALTAWTTLDYDGVSIDLGEVVQTAHRETGSGTVYQPLTIVPALSIALTQTSAIIPLGEKTLQLTAQIHSNAMVSTHAIVHLQLPAGWTSSPDRAPVTLDSNDSSATVRFTITPTNLTSNTYSVTAVAEADGKTYREGYKTVGYPGLTPVNRFRPAVCNVTGVPVKLPVDLHVAYLPGTGDEVASSLEDLGLHPTILTVGDLKAAYLEQFDAVVLGVRAYAAHADLAAATPQLLAYANNGGTVITQYNLTQFSGSVAPYPLALGNAEKVVDESAAVTLLNPNAQVLTWPNAITSRDFDGWIEERGHGFLDHWDAHYDAPTEVHDPGQDPQRGGLLVAPVGRGHYVYLAYALYRQLPEGVPGAYRLFANLLSLGRPIR